MPNTIINRTIVLSSVVGLLPETKAWLAVLPSKPNTLVINSVNNFIRAAKANGYWTLLDRLVLFAQDKQVNAVYSIVNPTSTPCTEVNSPTWGAYIGYTGNGSNMYINTNLAPSNGVNYTLNSSTAIIYSGTNSAINSLDFGCSNAATTNYLGFWTKYTDNKSYCYVNEGTTGVNGSITSSLGLFQISRTASNVVTVYQNGTSYLNGTSTSTGRCTVNCFVLARNNNGTPDLFSSRRISLFILAAGNITASTINSDIVTYLQTPLGF